MPRLEKLFFARDTRDVARELLGASLVYEHPAGRVSGRIVEVEAYMGPDDQACHGFRGRTKRAAPLFEEIGQSYIYLIYGMYWLFNVVAKPPELEDYPGAVLIRALEPLEGLNQMAQRRQGRPQREWTSGPGRLTLAMDIDKRLHQIDLTASESLVYFEAGEAIPDKDVQTGPRVGINVSEPWQSIPWRYWIAGNQYVSKTR